jgi:hypothetical protein
LEGKLENRNGVNPQISRVDGNHRLFYSCGYSEKKVKLVPIEASIPFSLTVGLDRREEAALFGDINGTAVKMNTSHLDHLKYRIIGEEAIREEELPLWIAEDLTKDPDSPFYDSIFLGGKKSKGKAYFLSLNTFKDGIDSLMRSSHELSKSEIPFELKSKAIKNFWRAVKNTFLTEWDSPKSNLLLSYFAYYGWSKLGAMVIDRSIRRENPTVDEMQQQLIGIKNHINWANSGPFKGYGGKGGGDKVFKEMKKWLPVEYALEKALQKLKES